MKKIIHSTMIPVDVGPCAMCVEPDGVWVRSGRDEIAVFVEKKVKPDVQNFADIKKEEFDQNASQQTKAFNQNAAKQTETFDSHAQEKTAEFDKNAQKKEEAFNQNAAKQTETFDSHAQEKTAEFDNNATQQTKAFNQNAAKQTEVFDTHAQEKTAEFDKNATQQTETFNQNAAKQTEAFDSHAQEKTAEFDNNASQQTEAFNQNAATQTGVFDSHAQDKTAEFDNNASQQTEAFNQNAATQTEAFDSHTQEKRTEFDRYVQEKEEHIQNRAENFDANIDDKLNRIEEYASSARQCASNAKDSEMRASFSEQAASMSSVESAQHAQVASMSASDALQSATKAGMAAEQAEALVHEAENYADNARQASQSASNAVQEARLWAIGQIEEQTEGSAKYWAGQAKLNAENSGGSVVDATEKEKGVVYLATDEQAQEGTDDSRAMTPHKTACNYVSLTQKQDIDGEKTFVDKAGFKGGVQVMACDNSQADDEQGILLSNTPAYNGEFQSTPAVSGSIGDAKVGRFYFAQNEMGNPQYVLEMYGNQENSFPQKALVVSMQEDTPSVSTVTPLLDSRNDEVATTLFVNDFVARSNTVGDSIGLPSLSHAMVASTGFEAPANGWLIVNAILNDSTTVVQVKVEKTYFVNYTASEGADRQRNTWVVPVAKGQTLTIQNCTVTFLFCRGYF